MLMVEAPMGLPASVAGAIGAAPGGLPKPPAHPRHGELEHALERVGSNMMRSLQVLEHSRR